MSFVRAVRYAAGSLVGRRGGYARSSLAKRRKSGSAMLDAVGVAGCRAYGRLDRRRECYTRVAAKREETG